MHLLLLLQLLCLAGNETLTYEFDGPRKPKVKVVNDGQFYFVTVNFIPVKSFDRTMNLMLSRQKAQTYAIQGLARFIKQDKMVELSVSEKEIIKSSINENNFEYTIKVPMNRVLLLAKSDKERKSRTESNDKSKKYLGNKADVNQADKTLKNPIKLGSYLAKEDFLDTLSVIATAFYQDLPKKDDDILIFQDRLDGAERSSTSRLSILIDQIKKDRWLLFNEKDELLQAVSEEEKKLYEAISHKLQERQAKEDRK